VESPGEIGDLAFDPPRFGRERSAPALHPLILSVRRRSF
jgi:hypothetical protein